MQTFIGDLQNFYHSLGVPKKLCCDATSCLMTYQKEKNNKILNPGVAIPGPGEPQGVLALIFTENLIGQ